MELIALRYNAGLSRDLLALRAGLGRETIRAAELGHPPTPRVQKALAKALDFDRREMWPDEVLPRPRHLTEAEKRDRALRRQTKQAA